MSTKMLTVGLMAGASMAQTIKPAADAPECTRDTAIKDCAELGTLIKPACQGNWICTPEARCGWKCDGIVLPTDTTAMCPAPNADKSVEKAYAACQDGVFNADTCDCAVRPVAPTCPDGSEVRISAELCFKEGGVIKDLSTCECVKPTQVEPCPQDVIDGCKKEGGVMEPAPSCECKRNIFCPAPFADIQKSWMLEKCRGGGLMLDPNTCECITPPTLPPVRTCIYGNEAGVPVELAKKLCDGLGSGNHVFNFDAVASKCSCKRLAIDTLAMCPAPLDNVPVDFARKECGAKGAFAYPRTFKFDAASCECTLIPADVVEPVDCAPFRSCDRENPCLKTWDPMCVPIDDATKECPRPSGAETNTCATFGAGGGVESVCPNGDSYEKSKLACLAKDPSIWHPLRCMCEPIVNTNKCPDGTDYTASKAKCLENGGRFVPEDCSCRKPADAVCADGTEYAAEREKCATDATKFWVEEPHCKCISKDVRPTTEGCKDFTSIAEAMRLCPGMAETPQTMIMDKDTCTCRKVVPTEPVPPALPYKQQIKMKICRDGLLSDDIKKAMVKIMSALKARLALKFPNAELVFNSIEYVDPCFDVFFTVLHQQKPRLTALISTVKDYSTRPEVLDTIRTTLQNGSEKDNVPVALAFEADGVISGGEAISGPPTPDATLASASTAAPALVSLAAAVFALFA